MSLNRRHPHLYVLPEDDANRQMAIGFSLHPNTSYRKMQVLEEAGGWRAVLDRFKKDHLTDMRRFHERRILLLLDFDKQSNRLAVVQADIPADLKERVFVLGAWTNPEDLRKNLNISLEKIGFRLAGECSNGTTETWTHELLSHNAAELGRLRADVTPLLFS